MRKDSSELCDNDPITLGEASKLLLRGIVTLSALRSEIKRGNLTVERIGKNLFTTPAAIREMRERCRVQPARPAEAKAAAIPKARPRSTIQEDDARLRESIRMLKSGELTAKYNAARKGPED